MVVSTSKDSLASGNSIPGVMEKFAPGTALSFAFKVPAKAVRSMQLRIPVHHTHLECPPTHVD